MYSFSNSSRSVFGRDSKLSNLQSSSSLANKNQNKNLVRYTGPGKAGLLGVYSAYFGILVAAGYAVNGGGNGEEGRKKGWGLAQTVPYKRPSRSRIFTVFCSLDELQPPNISTMKVSLHNFYTNMLATVEDAALVKIFCQKTLRRGFSF